MANERTRAICAKHFAWLQNGETADDDPAVSLANMRRGLDRMTPPVPSEVAQEKAEVGGTTGVWLTPPDCGDAVVLYLHGGGFLLGSARSHGDLAAQIALAAKAKVFLLEYRLAPDFQFPSQLDDSTAAYRGLLSSGIRPEQIVLAGDSAGGGLSLATTMNLRNQGLPLPRAIVTLSAHTDMTCSGPSLRERAHLDPIGSAEFTEMMAATYVPDPKERRNPLASPVFGDFSGFPPMLMQVGTSEGLYDDTQRVADAARQAGVEVEVQAADGMVHVYQQFWPDFPEGREAIDEIGRFVRDAMNAPAAR